MKVVRSIVQEKPTQHRNPTQRERLVHGKPAPGKERPPFRLPFKNKKIIYDLYNVCVIFNCFPFQYLFLGFKKAQTAAI